MYLEYITKYPEKKELAEKIVRNFIGRKAYLITLNDGTKYIDCHRNEWIKNGNTIICESMRTGLHYVLGNKPRKCIQEITDDAVIEVTSNDFVNRDTKFVD